MRWHPIRRVGGAWCCAAPWPGRRTAQVTSRRSPTSAESTRSLSTSPLTTAIILGEMNQDNSAAAG